MTEVAQVAAAVAHDMDSFGKEKEHNMSDAENKEDDVTHEEEDVAADEGDAAVDKEDAAEEESEKTSHTEDEKPCKKTDEASVKADKTCVNGVEHKEDDKVNYGKNEKSEAVNGVAENTKNNEEDNEENNEEDNEEDNEEEEPDTITDQNISELALKKEVRQEYKMQNFVFLKMMRCCSVLLMTLTSSLNIILLF